jgi:hypothetical protein
MDRERRASERRLRKDASHQGMQARIVTESSKFSHFEDVVGMWDFAVNGAGGEPGDDSSVSGLMTFDEARAWMAELAAADQLNG